MKKSTERQKFIIDLRRKGFSLKQIACEYEKKYCVKLSRERIRQILAAHK
jgi:DNA-binding transcriptional MerR regulator